MKKVLFLIVVLFGVSIFAATDIPILKALKVDNIKLDGNTISTTDTDGDLNIAPNGFGLVNIPTDLHLTGSAGGYIYTENSAGTAQPLGLAAGNGLTGGDIGFNPGSGTNKGGDLYLSASPSSAGIAGDIIISGNDGATADSDIIFNITNTGTLKILKTGAAPTVGQPWVATNVDGSGYWGTLGVGGGGTGISTGTSGGVPYFSSSSTLASSGALTANQLVIGGGAGSAPSSLAAGSQYQVLTMGASNPGYGAVNLAQSAAITGTLPIANGGTNNGSLGVTAGGVVYTDGTKLMNVGAGSTGQFLMSNGASAPTWSTSTAGGGSGINMLIASNPKAEDGTESPWTETGGGTLTTTSTAANVGNGSYAFSYDCSANADHADSPAITIPAGLYGQNCLLEHYYKGFDTNVTFQVHDGTNVIASYTPSAAATNYTRSQLNFVCPSSGTLQMRIACTGNAAIGYWDEVHLGSATNLGNNVIMSQEATYTPTIGATTTPPTKGAVNFDGAQWWQEGENLTLKYTFSQTGAGSAGNGTYLIPLPTGKVIDTTNYKINSTNVSTSVGHGWFYNGSTVFDVNVAIRDSDNLFAIIQSATADYGAWGSASGGLNNTTVFMSFVAKVKLSGAQNATTITDATVRTPTQQILTSGSSATYTRPAGVTHIRVRMTGDGGGGGGTGTTTTGGAGGATQDATFTIGSASGTVTLTASAGVSGTNGAGGSQPGAGGAATGGDINIPGRQGGTRKATSTADQGGDGADSPLGLGGVGGEKNGGSGQNGSGYGCGGGGGGSTTTTLTAAGGGGSAGYVEKWITAPDATGTYTVTNSGGTGGSAGTSGVSGGSGCPGIIIIDEYYGMNAPVMIGSITSNNPNGAERIERAKLNCDSGSAITSQSGSWVSSIGNVSGGACTVTLASGMFSAAPTCTVSTQTLASSDPVSVSVNVASSTSLTLDCADNAGADCTAYDVDVICMGPR